MEKENKKSKLDHKLEKSYIIQEMHDNFFNEALPYNNKNNNNNNNSKNNNNNNKSNNNNNNNQFSNKIYNGGETKNFASFNNDHVINVHNDSKTVRCCAIKD